MIERVGILLFEKWPSPNVSTFNVCKRIIKVNTHHPNQKEFIQV